MTDRFSEDEVVKAVARLTRRQLSSFVEAEIVSPVHTDDGIFYRQVDLVRMELLCELSEDFDLQDDSLAMVISLIDQLHSVRSDLRAVLQAIDQETDEVRGRIGEAIHRLQSG